MSQFSQSCKKNTLTHRLTPPKPNLNLTPTSERIYCKPKCHTQGPNHLLSPFSEERRNHERQNMTPRLAKNLPTTKSHPSFGDRQYDLGHEQGGGQPIYSGILQGWIMHLAKPEGKKMIRWKDTFEILENTTRKKIFNDQTMTINWIFIVEDII